MLNGKIGLYFFFAACAKQRAKLALVFSTGSFESSVEHFHFDGILVPDLNYIHSFIWNDKKIPLLSFRVQRTLLECNNRDICPDWGVLYEQWIQQLHATDWKHSAPDSLLSILPLNLSSLYSTKRSPSRLLFRTPLLIAASLSYIFLFAVDKIGYLWHKSLYPSRLRAQTVAGIIQRRSCNAQVNTSLRPPRLADKLKDIVKVKPFRAAGIKYS